MRRGRYSKTQIPDCRHSNGTSCIRQRTLTSFAGLFLMLLFLAGSLRVAAAQGPVFMSEPPDDAARSGPVASPDDPKTPRRHFRITDPARLSDEAAVEAYTRVKGRMAAGYALSRHPGTEAYQSWMRVNQTPYRSAAHGQRYLNNYVNDKARAYRLFEDAGKLPVGAVIAKDSFTVRSDGSTVPGALYLMEKMPDGFNHASGNWRYTMIMPDGSVFGTTRGVGERQVQFCVSCHLAVESQDHLFFVPKEYRQAGTAHKP